MLTKKEVKGLPQGFHSNSSLRKISSKQGVVNRSQRRMRKRKPLPRPSSSKVPKPIVNEHIENTGFVSKMWKRTKNFLGL